MFLGTYNRYIDSAGRVHLPGELRKGLANNNKIVIVGSGDHIEIWSKEGWEKEIIRITEILKEAVV